MREQGVESLWLDATGLAAFDAAIPDHRRLADGHRARSLARLAAHRPRRPLPVGRACSPTCRGPPRCPGCGPPARWPAPGCTGPTAWRPTRCSRGWCSAPVWPRPSPAAWTARPRPGPWPPCSWGSANRWARAGPCPWPAHRQRPHLPGTARWRDVVKARDELQRAMIAGAGVVRSADVARRGRRRGPGHRRPGHWRGPRSTGPRGSWPIWSLPPPGVLSSATLRCETRGAHARSDFPETVGAMAPPHRPHRRRSRPPRRAQATRPRAPPPARARVPSLVTTPSDRGHRRHRAACRRPSPPCRGRSGGPGHRRGRAAPRATSPPRWSPPRPRPRWPS